MWHLEHSTVACLPVSSNLVWAWEKPTAANLAALIEWPSIVLVGVVLGAFVYALYFPAFFVPRVLAVM